MTETLTRRGPRIDHPEELARLVKQIIARADPVAIYLFGSRARGDADAGSDYDLLIVVPDDFPAGEANTRTAFQCVQGRRIPMDVAMIRQSRFRERSGQIGTLSYQVRKDGILLHERVDRS